MNYIIVFLIKIYFSVNLPVSPTLMHFLYAPKRNRTYRQCWSLSAQSSVPQFTSHLGEIYVVPLIFVLFVNCHLILKTAIYRLCSPSIEKSPFRILSPKAISNGAKRSVSAGIFAPPVTGVHQLRVLSSKNLILTIVSTLYHSANTASPNPLANNIIPQFFNLLLEVLIFKIYQQKCPVQSSIKASKRRTKSFNKYPASRNMLNIIWKFSCRWSPCQPRMSLRTSRESLGI